MTKKNKKNYELAQKLISQQNFAAAVIGGAVAALLAAVAYGITVAKWPFSYGFAAVGIGIAIGLSMQFLGRGISTKFAVVAATYTVTGCAFGNLFRVIVELALSRATSPVDILRSNTLLDLADRSVYYYSLIDLVYWFVAVFFAVFLVKRPLSRSERLAIGLLELRD